MHGSGWTDVHALRSCRQTDGQTSQTQTIMRERTAAADTHTSVFACLPVAYFYAKDGMGLPVLAACSRRRNHPFFLCMYNEQYHLMKLSSHAGHAICRAGETARTWATATSYFYSLTLSWEHTGTAALRAELSCYFTLVNISF
jgi:hypothetical protein